MKNVLILGGTGAMGVHLLEELAESDAWDVWVTSRSKKEDHKNIKFLEGNARDDEFRKAILSDRHYDVIVDFMNYGYDEFKTCHSELLKATDHYVFLSSSRVYARSETAITEDSPRLLDVTDDEEFLSTQRYALRKARQEDMLFDSGSMNFTIVRPYITYSNRRLQLGIYEKEQWLYRILNNKPLVIREEILNSRTTLTYGKDVSREIYNIMNHAPLGEAVHIMSEETMTWKEILNMYVRIIKEEIGLDPQIFTAKSMEEAELLFEGGYNTKYDRLWDRFFDNAKAEKEFGHIEYLDMRTGLERCLKEFLNDWKTEKNNLFLDIVDDFETIMDDMCQEGSDTELKKLTFD